MKRFITFILLALALVGGGYASWTYWQKQKDKSSSNNTQTQDELSGNRYLVIREWGVKLTLNEDVKDAKYIPGVSGIYLTTTALQNVKGCEMGGAFAIERGKRGDSIGASTVEEVLSNNPNALKKIGDYYYLLTGPAISCASDEDNEGKEILGKARQGFSEAYSTIQAN